MVGVVTVRVGGVVILIVHEGDQAASTRSYRGGGGTGAGSVGAQGSIDEAVLGTHSCQ